eukprot:3981839-Ditylum_brightwellii.AAC.1
MAKDAIDEINMIKKQELEDKQHQQQGGNDECNDRGKQDDESSLLYTPCHVLDIGGGYPGYDGVGGDIQHFCGGGCFDDFFDNNDSTIGEQRKDEASKIAQGNNNQTP